MNTSASSNEQLAAQAREHVRASETALRQRDVVRAVQHARAAVELLPEQAETLRQLAVALSSGGPSDEALMLIDQALALRPDDAQSLTTRAIVLEANGQRAAAVDAFIRAYEADRRSAAGAFNAGWALAKAGRPDDALRLLDAALTIDPQHRRARAAKADALRQVGRNDEAAAELRDLIQRDPKDSLAWSVLAATNHSRFGDDELALLERIHAEGSLPDEAKAYTGFALGRVYESRARFAEAFSVFVDANRLVRERVKWDGAQFVAEAEGLIAKFTSRAATNESHRGEGTVFIVSLPRSGSTLTEQILAAHPHVDAGEERRDLVDVIAAEGRRRRQPLAQWSTLATAEDWKRLGDEYLRRTRASGSGRQVSTDKLPGNWLWLGAAFAMLPGARVVDCRRDILETAWSCFTHFFSRGAQVFSYDFASIAIYADVYQRTTRHWKTLYPDLIRTQVYEELVRDTEPQVRELLAFCGLDFDPACLRFHEANRAVRSASATQVREPLRKDTARTHRYGALLDPLRDALGLPRFGAG